MPKNTFSLKTRLILAISLIMLVAVLATSIINYQVSRNSVRKEIFTSSLPLTRDTIYSEILQTLSRPIHVSSTMANDAFLKNWINSGEKDILLLSRYLKKIMDKYGYFSSFFVSETTGNYYYDQGILKRISKNDSHDVWYYDFIDSGKEYQLDVDTNQAAGNILTIFINFSVHDDQGRLLGVTGVGLKMDQAASLLKTTQEKFGRRLFMFDTTGLIQVHSDRSMILKTNLEDLPGIGALKNKILLERGAPANFEYDSEHGRVLLTVRYIPALDWFLVVEQDENTALSSARRNLVNTVVIGLLASLIVIALSVFTINHFQSRLERMALTDELTKVYNRRAFGPHFSKAQARNARHGNPFSILLIDIDRFKEINDQRGHVHGDKVLVALAEIIQESIRPSDTMARWGGDEFTVLAECPLSEALTIAERVRTVFAGQGLDGPEGATTTVSCGVTQYVQGETLDNVLLRVDKALYKAKKDGRNSVVSI